MMVGQLIFYTFAGPKVVVFPGVWFVIHHEQRKTKRNKLTRNRKFYFEIAADVDSNHEATIMVRLTEPVIRKITRVSDTHSQKLVWMNPKNVKGSRND